ncbi:hypothetical protein FH972_001686 [Carpinus fangiana]|uniref:Uncharacterized protein n=1 Tax=Carpinus fangiana TaxID=176857 RepID=A0A5N6QFP4_9ROSI|nr:hypothetical protein FH972_001686 [Carpinus fangiana]
MPYSHDRNSHISTPIKAQPLAPVLAPSHLTPPDPPLPLNLDSTPPTLLTPPTTPHSIPYPQEKPPFLVTGKVSEDPLPSPATHSKGKESVFSDSLSPLEIAAYSLTQLQHAAPSIGPVQEFLVQPFQGRLQDPFPQSMVFAPDVAAGTAFADSPAHASAGSKPSSPASVAVSASRSRRFTRSP